jgi:hypothetical protein
MRTVPYHCAHFGPSLCFSVIEGNAAHSLPDIIVGVWRLQCLALGQPLLHVWTRRAVAYVAAPSVASLGNKCDPKGNGNWYTAQLSDATAEKQQNQCSIH